MGDNPLWSPDPSDFGATRLSEFMALAADRTGRPLDDFSALHAWSVADPSGFWELVWSFTGVRGAGAEGGHSDLDRMPGAHFFRQGELNFAENLLNGADDGDAIVFRGEDKVERRIGYRHLRDRVAALQHAMREAGIGAGDRVAAMMPNMPETIIAMLAATSLGAIWSSCSPDFGEKGVLDRFGQIEPRMLIACDGYWYNGKRIDVADKLVAIAEKLPSVEKVLVTAYAGECDALVGRIPNAVPFDEFATGDVGGADMEFPRFPFDHPLYILFSSGTTGVPKCIVHGAGGTLLQHLKEQQLHCNIRPGDKLFYFTTCGWMMWNWLVSGLASGATLILYDGSPFYPDGNVLFDFTRDERINFFGTSAKFIDAVRKAGLEPVKTHDLGSLRTIASTGSPLAPENFDFVYSAIKPDVHLASISGGTDIVSCFVLGIPGLPVYKGEIQGPGLGMAVDVWDEDGRPVREEKGELVCTRPFPSMPIGFWNDPDGSKYHAAYFDRFDNVWCHGDFAEWTEHGGMIIHGRSDATLNPGGVRIGTAEIYNQVEQMPEILEALAIGQDWDHDVRVILFVRLAEGVTLSDDLQQAIRLRIRQGASPRHVPAVIVAVADIPRTKSGKITELAVREIVHGRQVRNQEALANPEALELYRDLEELKV
ncbi:MAG TPA: acetoacetate--CoA ligase [Afifellaceae bacterium]|nr:acetoacetate--CoA ligase [Afifellaceae bacterium]